MDRLDRYSKRTQTPLDVLALVTLWLVVVPPTKLGIDTWLAVILRISTVGYGDVYPVTAGGRITAVALMVLAFTVLAVVTAQIASRFIDQAARDRAAAAAGQARPTDERS